LKIGIDAHAAERDGTGNCTYIRGILTGLVELNNQNEYVLYITNKSHSFYDIFRHKDNFQLHVLRPKHPLVRIPLSLARRTFLDGIDILHVQYIAPPFHKGKLITTIHDLGFFHFRESFSPFERIRSSILIPRNARRAAKIITGSQFSKTDIINKLKVNDSRIEITPYGNPIGLTQPQINIIDIRKKYGITKKFIFSLGRLNMRKNLKNLISAYAELRQKENVDLNLVIAGKKDYLTTETLMEVKKSGYDKDIIITGYIPQEELPLFYKTAEIFVYPSLFEGFGLPPLEAMAWGCPVITSNVSSLPEVVGEAALLINPHQIQEITDAMKRVLSNAGLKRQLHEEGKKRAKLFTWEKTAEKTLKIYEDVYNA
jgi:glycosyltransferase involved in cell wall biosynthesis